MHFSITSNNNFPWKKTSAIVRHISEIASDVLYLTAFHLFIGNKISVFEFLKIKDKNIYER